MEQAFAAAIKQEFETIPPHGHIVYNSYGIDNVM